VALREYQVVGQYHDFFDKIAPALQIMSEDLPFYHDYATVLYKKWDEVQKVGPLCPGKDTMFTPAT
jgi:hypothetical protein